MANGGIRGLHPRANPVASAADPQRPRSRRPHPRRSVRADPAAWLRQHDRGRGGQHRGRRQGDRLPTLGAQGRSRGRRDGAALPRRDATTGHRVDPRRTCTRCSPAVLNFVNSPTGIDYIRTTIKESMRDERIAALYREANERAEHNAVPVFERAISRGEVRPDIPMSRRGPVPRRRSSACVPSPGRRCRAWTRSTASSTSCSTASVPDPAGPARISRDRSGSGRAGRRRTPRRRTAPGRRRPRRGRPA